MISTVIIVILLWIILGFFVMLLNLRPGPTHLSPLEKVLIAPVVAIFYAAHLLGKIIK